MSPPSSFISPQIDAERKRHYYTIMMESFAKRWAPRDPYENHLFHAELDTIIRQVYEDAASPWREQIMKIVDAYASRSLSIPFPLVEKGPHS
jgi:hypothetical protein